MKILAIGNSFSVDAMQWLYEIARDCGLQEVVLGNLYIGGCSLERHCENTVNGSAEYIYYKNTAGVWEEKEGSTLLDGIKDEAWDVITFQQYSGHSGMAETFDPYLAQLKDFVKREMTNPEAKFYWHMTWAYQAGAEHPDFVNYNGCQETMYRAIVKAAEERILPDADFSGIIPAGTAVQNVRKSAVGDQLTRDGYHLSLNLGRYIAGLTWVRTLWGVSIDAVTFVPDAKEVPAEVLAIVKQAVNAAAGV